MRSLTDIHVGHRLDVGGGESLQSSGVFILSKCSNIGDLFIQNQSATYSLAILEIIPILCSSFFSISKLGYCIAHPPLFITEQIHAYQSLQEEIFPLLHNIFSCMTMNVVSILPLLATPLNLDIYLVNCFYST